MIKKIILTLITLVLFTQTSSATIPSHIQDKLGSLPVLYNGRVQPIDSVGRYGLLTIQEKSNFKRESQSITATQWIWDLFLVNTITQDDPIFLIDDIDIKHEFQLDDKRKRFSYNELEKHLHEIGKKVVSIEEIEQKERSAYEKNIWGLWAKLYLFNNFSETFIPYNNITLDQYLSDYRSRLENGLTLFNQYNKTGLLEKTEDQLALLDFNRDFKLHKRLLDSSNLYFYPQKNKEWTNTGSELLALLNTESSPHQALSLYATLSSSLANKDWEGANSTLDTLHQYFEDASPSHYKKSKLEYKYNKINPLKIAIILYLLSFILVFVFYLIKKNKIYSFAQGLAFSAFILQTVALIIRMIITDRPPVTNLYSSAVFVGWFAILAAFIQEYFYKNKIGVLVSSSIGFITLIIAHHLSIQGDTLEVMQAVLDSNFWLSTHVITITLGYSGTFVAGLIATIYILGDKWMTASKQKEYSKMVYGIICFSLFFSFIGTVLGGIWGDQSWGRFWGWDPKENGALLIVIWNAIILHARLDGLIKNRGLMLYSVAGNMITSFSWWGVNMLGVGLHSYGFMNEAFKWLIIYFISQLAIIGYGLTLKEKKEA